MTNTELTKIREQRNLSKSEFAKLLGVTAMLLGRYEKGSCAIPEDIAKKALAASDAATASETEVKKTRKGKKVKKAEEVVAEIKEAVEDKVVAEEIEVKKTVRKGTRKAKETASAAKETVKKKAAGLPNIIIQSPMGGYITPADIAKKVPKDAADVYVRVDENKLYYVLKNGESGDVDIWE